jgi:hypothetical protein
LHSCPLIGKDGASNSSDSSLKKAEHIKFKIQRRHLFAAPRKNRLWFQAVFKLSPFWPKNLFIGNTQWLIGRRQIGLPLKNQFSEIRIP